jgi:serine/threonine-protein kinase
MQTRRDFVTWLSALSLVGLARPLAADDRAEEAATNAARSWLSAVDDERYLTSWNEAAPMFKNVVTTEQWDQAVRSVRTPLGRCLSRTLRSRKLVDAPPGAPRGPYVVIQFATDFERKPDAVETITPALGTDGRWRVAGYFIR